MPRSRPLPQARPAAPRAPVVTQHGVQLVIPPDPWDDVTLSEFCVRVTRQLAASYWRTIGSPRDISPHDLYVQARHYWRGRGAGLFDTWFVAYAWACSQGLTPAQYCEDVLRRARGHNTQRARGNPWHKQR